MRWIFRFFLYHFATGPWHNCCSLFDFGVKVVEIFFNQKLTSRRQQCKESPTLRIVDTQRGADYAYR